MEPDRSEACPVGPASEFHHLPVIDRHDKGSGPNEEQVLQPNTMLASGDLERLHFSGPHVANDGVIDYDAVVVPKAHELWAGLVDLDDCVTGHPSIMHEMHTLTGPVVRV